MLKKTMFCRDFVTGSGVDITPGLLESRVVSDTTTLVQIEMQPNKDCSRLWVHLQASIAAPGIQNAAGVKSDIWYEASPFGDQLRADLRRQPADGVFGIPLINGCWQEAGVDTFERHGVAPVWHENMDKLTVAFSRTHGTSGTIAAGILISLRGFYFEASVNDAQQICELRRLYEGVNN